MTPAHQNMRFGIISLRARSETAIIIATVRRSPGFLAFTCLHAGFWPGTARPRSLVSSGRTLCRPAYDGNVRRIAGRRGPSVTSWTRRRSVREVERFPYRRPARPGAYSRPDRCPLRRCAL